MGCVKRKPKKFTGPPEGPNPAPSNKVTAMMASCTNTWRPADGPLADRALHAAPWTVARVSFSLRLLSLPVVQLQDPISPSDFVHQRAFSLGILLTRVEEVPRLRL